MDFSAYNPRLDDDPLKMRTGKKLFPERNMHYSTSLSASGAYSDFFHNILEHRLSQGKTYSTDSTLDQRSTSIASPSEVESLKSTLKRREQEISRLKEKLKSSNRLLNGPVSLSPQRKEPFSYDFNTPRGAVPTNNSIFNTPTVNQGDTRRNIKVKNIFDARDSPIRRAGNSIYLGNLSKRNVLRPSFN